MASLDSGQTVTTAPVAEAGAHRTPEHISVFRRVPWQVRDIVIGLAPLLVWRLPVSIDRGWIISLPAWAYWVFYVSPPLIWMMLFPVWIARRRSSAQVLAIPRTNKLIKEAVISLLAWLAICVSAVAILAAAVLIFGKDAIPANPWEGVSGSNHPASTVVFLMMAITFGPVSEEIFFRGFLYNALRRRCPTAVALVLQSLLFSLMHTYGIGHSVVAFFLGLVLAAIYDWRKTLLAPIFVHCIQNSVASIWAALLMIAAMNAPHLGVNGTAHEGGCLIAVVYPDTTAEEIGLRKGDIIAKFDGQSVHDIADLAKLVRQKTVGDQVEIEVMRDHRTILKEAVLRR